MKIIYNPLIFLILIITFNSCKGSKNKFDESIPVDNHFDNQRFDSSLLKITKILPDSFTAESSWIKFYYINNNFKAQWVNTSDRILKTDTLISFLSRSEEHGISTQQFDLDTLILLNKKHKKNDLTYATLAFFELKISIAYLKYCRALKFGLVQPEKISPNYFYSTQTIDSSFVWECFKNKDKNIYSFLKSIQPVAKNYKKLQAERKKYLLLIDSTFTPIPELADKKTIKLGTWHKSISLINKRLSITKELTFNNSKHVSDSVFDDNLLVALNIFRIKTGLFIDEEIGNNTIRALNFPFKNYVKKIDINLERMRWKPTKKLGDKFIKVNVANMTLKAYRADTVALKMKVCVGKNKNKTPFLRSNIFEIILNPTWSIPKSIVVKETSLSAASDTNYLKRNRIKIFRKGEEIHSSKIDWTKISEKYQPYKLVQDPGNFNALGRIKFNFANKFSVYLHDTNAKSAFRRHNRAVSHGCVRVEKPLELSFFCLPEYDRTIPEKIEIRQMFQDKIRHSIRLDVVSAKAKELLQKNASAMKLNRVSTNPTIPLIIEYLTCYVNDEGEVVFKEDIYDLDHYIADNMSIIKHFKIPELTAE